MVEVKEIEWTSEQLVALEGVKVTFSLVALEVDDLPILEEIQDILKSELNSYGALGIIDGLSYFSNIDSKKAILERLNALINLLKVLLKTNNTIKREE